MFSFLYYVELTTKELFMVRISKQEERRQPSKKTGPLVDHLPNGFKNHANAIEGDLAQTLFIPKIK